MNRGISAQATSPLTMPLGLCAATPAASATLPRGLASGFSPLQIANCILSLDASDSTTITIQTGASQWRNQALAGSRFEQTTANNQPTLTDASGNPATINGRQALFFDGSNDLMQISQFDAFRQQFRAISGVSAYAAFLRIGAGGTPTAIVLGTEPILLGVQSPVVGYRRSPDAPFLTWPLSTEFPRGQAFVAGVRWDIEGRVLRGITGNGAVITTRRDLTNSSGVTQSLALTDARVGNWFGQTTAILLGEVIMYNRVLSDAEDRIVVSYLRSKWGA